MMQGELLVNKVGGQVDLRLAPSDPPASGVLMALHVDIIDRTLPAAAQAQAAPTTRGVLLLGFRVGDLLARTASYLGSDRAAQLRTILFGRHGDAREVHLGGSLAALGVSGTQLEATESIDVDSHVEVCGQRWRLRGRIGERIKWYRDVDEVQ